MPQHVLIVGAGCFGLSTAIHLLSRGHRVTVIDRATTLPAPDAASTDLNKIVRSSYADPFYTKFAQEAIQTWKNGEWGNIYHESGVMNLISVDRPDSYTHAAYENDRALGSQITGLLDTSSITGHFPKGLRLGVRAAAGYLNIESGWANATGGIRRAMDIVRACNGEILEGRQVSHVNFGSDGQAGGVTLVSGEVIDADVTVIATGSWTGSLLSDVALGLDDRILATGQSLGTITLSDEEADLYRSCPVVLDFDTGFYVFPPNAENVMKVAIHDKGYVNMQKPTPSIGSRLISTPRTIASHPADGTAIPREMVDRLHSGLASIYPDLAASHSVDTTRLCWYTDTPDSNWLIDFHPEHPGLLFATGGSGHAYKFLPVLGRLVTDRLEGKLDPDLAARFSFTRPRKGDDRSRPDQTPRNLDEEALSLGNIH